MSRMVPFLLGFQIVRGGGDRLGRAACFVEDESPKSADRREGCNEGDGRGATDLFHGQDREDKAPDMASNQRAEMPEQGRRQASLDVEGQHPPLRGLRPKLV